MPTDETWKMVADWQSKELARLMRRLGIVGASFSEIVDVAIKRLDGAEAVIDKLRGHSCKPNR